MMEVKKVVVLFNFVVSGCSFAQVQLLVSNEDVENYKQIKSDLDELRLLVEKSELWVYKGKSPSVFPVQAPGLKKRKSKPILVVEESDDQGKKDHHGMLQKRASDGSQAVRSR